MKVGNFTQAFELRPKSVEILGCEFCKVQSEASCVGLAARLGRFNNGLGNRLFLG